MKLKFDEINVNDIVYCVSRYTRYSNYEVVKATVVTKRKDDKGDRIAVRGNWLNGDEYSASFSLDANSKNWFSIESEAVSKADLLNSRKR